MSTVSGLPPTPFPIASALRGAQAAVGQASAAAQEVARFGTNAPPAAVGEAARPNADPPRALLSAQEEFSADPARAFANLSLARAAYGANLAALGAADGMLGEAARLTSPRGERGP